MMDKRAKIKAYFAASYLPRLLCFEFSFQSYAVEYCVNDDGKDEKKAENKELYRRSSAGFLCLKNSLCYPKKKPNLRTCV